MRSEFQFIQHIKERYSLRNVGDDCAVLPKDEKTDMVVTTDLLVEDIDFRLEWTTPEFLGHKALAVSLSDIAAMGAEPRWAMLSIGVPESLWKTDFLDKYYEGWFTLARHHKVELVGGDISRTTGKVIVDSIVGGEVRKNDAILRSTARVDDQIFVTGSLGGAAGGLMLLESGSRYADVNDIQKKLLDRQLRPQPQLAKAKYLSLHCLATSMTDISDGLSSDIAHICHSSGVGAQIMAEDIPTDPNLDKLSSNFDQHLDFALHGGEDFELLFTGDRNVISKQQDFNFKCIGRITENVGVIEIVKGDRNLILESKGFTHF